MSDKKPPEKQEGRPWISMHFECCNKYLRIYINKERTKFVGWCPGCMRKVEIKVDPNAGPNKFFSAG